jgi:acetyl-CoA carboxylase carboxyltransferase component
VGVITAFIRVEGRPMGVIANNPHHLAGAVEARELRHAEAEVAQRCRGALARG